MNINISNCIISHFNNGVIKEHSHKKSGGLGFQELTLSLGIFICIFRYLQQEWIHFRGFESRNPPKYALCVTVGCDVLISDSRE